MQTSTTFQNTPVQRATLSTGKTKMSTYSLTTLAKQLALGFIGASISAAAFASYIDVPKQERGPIPQAATLPDNVNYSYTVNRYDPAINAKVEQTARKVVIDWTSFNLGKNNTLTFVQPDAGSIALNRVVGSEASNIAGQLNANGLVFLINPNGIVFAPGAQVNVGGLLASTLAMSNDDFYKGTYKLSTAAGKNPADVVNAGTLNAKNGGFVALVGNRNVTNSGTISTPEGRTALAAGSTVTLNLGANGSSLVRLSVDAAAAQDVLLTNSGTITTMNGDIQLTAKGANLMNTLAINNTGTLEASGLSVGKGGTITLDAPKGETNFGGAGEKIKASDANLTIKAEKLFVFGPDAANRLKITAKNIDVTSAWTYLQSADLSAQGNVKIASEGVNLYVDSASITAGNDITLTSKWNLLGGGWATGLGAGALLFQNANLSAGGTMTLSGTANTTGGSGQEFGAAGIYVSNSSFKARNGVINGATNSWYQNWGSLISAGISFYNNVGLDGQFTINGSSTSGAPALWFANANFNLSPGSLVNASATGTPDTVSMQYEKRRNLGLAAFYGNNTINGSGTFNLNAAANSWNSAILFYYGNLTAAQGTTVNLTATNVGAASADNRYIANAIGLVGTSRLENLKLNGTSKYGMGISVSPGGSLLNVIAQGESENGGAGIGIYDSLVTNSSLSGRSRTGAGIAINGNAQNSSFDGSSITGAGVDIGAASNLFNRVNVIGRSNSGAGILFAGNMADNSSLDGRSTGGAGVEFTPTAQLSKSKVTGNSTGASGVRLSGSITKSEIEGNSTGAKGISQDSGTKIDNDTKLTDKTASR